MNKGKKMNEENKVILPEDFDGVFRFTNATDEDFTAYWAKIPYTFKAQSTTPMIIMGATPEEVQHIRKKFAKELAEREFYKGSRIRQFDNQNTGTSSVKTAITYSPKDLEPFIEQCLTPLPIAKITIGKAIPEDDTKFHKDSKNRRTTKVIEKDESLVGEGQVIG